MPESSIILCLILYKRKIFEISRDDGPYCDMKYMSMFMYITCKYTCYWYAIYTSNHEEEFQEVKCIYPLIYRTPPNMISFKSWGSNFFYKLYEG